MAKKPETLFKEKVLPELKSRYGKHGYFEKISQVALRGTPDILGCIKGQMVVIELKIDGEEADPLQSYLLDRWEAAGAVRLVMTPSSYLKDLALLDAIG